MGIEIFASSEKVILWDYINIPKNHEEYYIGRIRDYFDLAKEIYKSFDSEKEKIKDERIKQFKYITELSNTIFNREQVKQLREEIKILEKSDFDKEMLEVIKKGISKVLERDNLYLKFEYD